MDNDLVDRDEWFDVADPVVAAQQDAGDLEAS
jgi:hypothetical protein